MNRKWWPDLTFLYTPLRDTAFYIVFGVVIGFGLIDCNEKRGDIDMNTHAELTENIKEEK